MAANFSADIQKVHDFYSGESENSLSWKDIFTILHSIISSCDIYTNPDISFLLSCHFRSQQLTGEDDDEIEVAGLLMGLSRQQPMDQERITQAFLGNLKLDSCSPLHYFFMSKRSEYDRMKYVLLLIDVTDNVDSDGNFLCRLLSAQIADNCFVTPMHYMADNVDIESSVVQVILRKLNDLFVLKRDAHEIFVPKKRWETHPLAIPDEDGELPIHYACSNIDGEPEQICSFLGILKGKHEQINLNQLVFWARADGYIPATILLESFLMEDYSDYDILEQICNDSGASFPGSTLLSFQQLLASKSCKIIPPVRELYEKLLWPRLKILLLVAMECNASNTKLEGGYVIPEQDDIFDVHLAARVQNFPSFALKLAILINPHDLVQRDQSAKIPLHYAIESNLTPGCQNHLKNSAGQFYWDSTEEPRTMVEYLIEISGATACIPDPSKRLPIHLAVECDCGLKSIIAIVKAAPHSLGEPDPISSLIPFMMAASNRVTDAGIDCVYFLLRSDPSLIKKM